MTKEKPLGKNLLYSGAAAISNVMLVGLLIIAARILGAKSFGNFSFALAIASIFETFMDLGMSTLIARNVARDRERAGEYLANILGWKLVLSAVAMLMLFITVNLLNESREATLAAYIFGGAIILRSYKSTTHAFFQSHERFDLLVLTTYVERIVVLIAGLAALLISRSLLVFATAFALVRIPDLIFSMWLVHKNITRVHISFSPAAIKRIQLAALPFGSYAVVGVMYSYVGTVVLSAMVDPEHVGWYSAGYKIYEGLTMFPYLVCAVLLPRLSRLHTEEPEQYKSLLLRIIRYMVLTSIPLLVCISLISPQVIRLLYGTPYLAAIPMLQVLLGAAAMMFISSLLGTALVSADRERVVLKVTCANLVVMATANLILVHEMGAMGAAYSVLISEGFALLAYFFSIGRTVLRIPAPQITWRPVAACAFAGIALKLSTISDPCTLIVLFLAVYGSGLFALRTFSTDDWEVLRGLIITRRETG